MFRNATYDLTAEELAAAKALDVTYVNALRLGTSPALAPTDPETVVIRTMIRACRGRGIARPVDLLLGAYYGASTARPAVSDCTNVPGLTTDRTIENT